MTGRFGILTGPPSSHPQVGDRLDTDILFGKENGTQAMLVLSGVTSEDDLLSPKNHIVPDHYTSKLGDLLTVKAKANALA